MKHAIILVAGKQYFVAPKETIVTDHVDGTVGDSITFDHVLLVSDDKKTSIGTPTVKGAKVKAKILTQGKGEKIDVRRFKSKVRYRKHIGFRPHQTTFEITDIG